MSAPVLSLEDLASEWMEMKEAERRAVERRREIEDAISVLIGINDTDEGTKTNNLFDYTIKISTRLNKKVDADIAQEVAAEHGLEEYLGSVFRWKPEINAAGWKSAGDNVRSVFSKAITVSPSRPTYAITKKG